jgi:hypothetical protein
MNPNLIIEIIEAVPTTAINEVVEAIPAIINPPAEILPIVRDLLIYFRKYSPLLIIPCVLVYNQEIREVFQHRIRPNPILLNAPELTAGPQPLVIPQAPPVQPLVVPEAPPVNPLPIAEHAQDPYPVIPASEEADSTEDALPEEESRAVVSEANSSQTLRRVASETSIVEARRMANLQNLQLTGIVVGVGAVLYLGIKHFYK